MNKVLNFIIILYLISISFAPVAYAQDFEAGWSLGGANYSGDLTENAAASLRQTRAAGGILVRYSLHPFFGVRLQFHLLQLTASDAISKQDWKIKRNLSFHSTVQDFDFLFDIKPFGGYQMLGRWSPIVSAGFSIFHFDPMRNFEGNDIRLVELGTEGQGLPGRPPIYRLSSTALSFGGSLHYQINSKWSTFIEAMWRSTSTDFLDDVSGKYADYDLLLNNRGRIAAEIGNGIKAPAGAQRGNIHDNDWFQTFLLGFQYKLFDLGYQDKRQKKSSRGKLKNPTIR